MKVRPVRIIDERLEALRAIQKRLKAERRLAVLIENEKRDQQSEEEGRHGKGS